MPEHERQWFPLPDRDTHRIEIPGLVVRNVLGLAQHMVSGNLWAASLQAGVDMEGVGALAVASGNRYSVRLARDRLLVVSSEEGLFRPGWHQDGYAVTCMSAGLEVFDMVGELSEEVVKRATTLSPAAPGPCAATVFAGVTACVYRFGDGETVRVHLDRGLDPYLWDWLRAQVDAMEPAV